MSTDYDNGRRRCLDDEQKFNAKELIRRGYAILDVARHYGLSETELRREIDLPQRQSELDQERHKTRFDLGGK